MSVSGKFATISETALEVYPVPQNTRTWTLTPQQDLVKTAMRVLGDQGIEFLSVNHMVHKDKPVFVTEGIVRGSSLVNTQGEEWTIAIMNSYDKTISARMLFGRRVFICSNGIIHADKVLGAKHTGKVWDRVEEMCKEVVTDFLANQAYYAERQETLKHLRWEKSNLAHFAMDLVRRGVLGKQSAFDFYDQTTNPPFKYDAPELSFWLSQAAFTHLAKSMEPVHRARRNLAFEKCLTQRMTDPTGLATYESWVSNV